MTIFSQAFRPLFLLIIIILLFTWSLDINMNVIISTVMVIVCMTSSVTSETYIATLNMNGVKEVDIIFTTTSSQTTIEVVDGIPAAYTSIKLMPFPVIFGRIIDAAAACSNLGTATMELFNATGATTKLFEFTESTFRFKSVTITGSGQPTICANILGTVTKTYRAKFVGTVAGEVWYRTSSSVASAFGDVYSTSSSLTGAKNLNIYPNAVGESFAERCGNLGNSLSQLTTGITVPTTASNEGRFTISSTNAAANPKSLGFVDDGGSIIACANLVEVQEESATSTFNWNNVRGTIQFKQPSPFDKTIVKINLSGLNDTAAGFHVHKYPVPQRASAIEERCGPELVSGHFNPYGIVVDDSPASGTGTVDQYEIGDLSGKFGLLTGKSLVASYNDWNLPMFGINSIVGRSIVIHRPDGSRWICSTIEPDYDISVAVATFKTPIFGNVYMTQRSSDPESDTSVFIEFASHMMTGSNNHNWHVHQTILGADQLTDDGRCASAGGHYNPFAVEMGDSYTSCTSSTPYRCELGDSSSKMGTVNIGSSNRKAQSKFFSTDSYLPLSGPFSIMQRSVVVHGADKAAARIACANVLPLHPLKVATQSWKGGSAISGGIQITQSSEFVRSKVTSNVSGMGTNAKNYHIHETQITPGSSAADACQPTSVGGHYNPFNIAVIPYGETNDKYEVGDLSGKYGPITSDALNLNNYDTNLPLFTGLSAADKSIVIHAASDGSRWRCSDLLFQPSTVSGGYVVTATATFNSVVKGTINLRQVVYEDWSASPTGMELSVNMPDASKSLQHNWHIHIDPVTSEDSCSIAQGHYNPYSAPIKQSFYSTECKMENPLMCEVGDLSKKHSKYDIGGGKKAFVDVDVPLHTPFTVLGRSIVFHVKAGGSPRYACANIVPDENVYTMSFVDTTTFDAKTFTTTLASSLGVSESRVVIMHNTDIPVTKNGCSRVMVYIVGGTSKASSILDGTLENMGGYATSDLCTNKEGALILGQTSDGLSNLKNSVLSWSILIACFAYYFGSV